MMRRKEAWEHVAASLEAGMSVDEYLGVAEAAGEPASRMEAYAAVVGAGVDLNYDGETPYICCILEAMKDRDQITSKMYASMMSELFDLFAPRCASSGWRYTPIWDFDEAPRVIACQLLAQGAG